MTATRCPFATWRPITTNHSEGGRQRIRGFVPHVQDGNGSLFGFFNRPKPPGERASADTWCSKTGVLEQYVDLDDQSYAQGSKQHNGNPYMVSCEFEGFPNEPMTDAQIDKGGQLIAWVITDVNPFELVVNHTPGEEGITPHYVFGGGHTCPGPGPREGQFPDLIDAAKRWLGDAPVTPQPGDIEMLDRDDPVVKDLFANFEMVRGTKPDTHFGEVVGTGAIFDLLKRDYSDSMANFLLIREGAADAGIDEQALAAALAPLIRASIPTLSDADLQAIATAVNDEDARRKAN